MTRLKPTRSLDFSRRDFTGLVLGMAAWSAGWAVPARAEDLRSDIVGEPRVHVIQEKETLIRLARVNNVGILELMAVNPGIDPWIPEVGTLIVIPTMHILPDAPRKGIVINLAELRLYYFPGDDQPVYTTAIGVGREGFTTPLGSTQIVRKQAKPTWYPTETTRIDRPELPAAVPPGPDNPLGLFALYLGWPTFLIHGTNKPPGVGRRVSRGCIRMYPESVEYLFGLVSVGTPVTTVMQSVKLGWHEGDLYIEVHPDHDQIDQLEMEERFDTRPVEGMDQAIVDAAGLEAYRLDWHLIRAALRERRGMPVKIMRDRSPSL